MATRFASAGWSECSCDRQLGAVVLGLERLTPDLAKALVERFGTEDVIIQLMPHS